MAIFKTSNPVLSEKKFRDTVLDEVVSHENAMTVKGTLQKFGFLFLMVMGSAFYSWKEFAEGGNVMPLIWTGAIGGLVIAIVITFKKEWSPYLAPAYALLEGLFVGAISAYYDFAFAAYAPNIIMNAVGLTFGTCIAMYLLYTFKIIKATAKFKAIVITATTGIFVFYMITLALSFFGISIPFLHESSALGIGFSIFVVALAALNLILNFDMIENGVAMGAPKYMEWYSAFGLLVVIVWLYLEILRLLSLLSGRD
ncbi:MAG TPA: Bax inhibitor-1/YccA family protein [Ferruginibacter sp.]|nr:Bax inhibitor-1/YccA family protein [Ferruginibacter sp.]